MTRSAAVVVVAAVAFGLVLLQTTAVNLALPVIRDAFGADVGALQWCASAYAVVVAGTLLPAGVVCDRLGASRGLLLGLTVLIAGAAVSSSAPTVAVVVVGQGIAGLGAAFVLPAATGVLVEATSPGPARARAVGLLGVGGAVGFGLGPLVAGATATAVGWRGVFVAPGMLVALVLVAALTVVPASTMRRSARGPHPLTVGATVLMVGGLAFLLIDGNASGWGRAVPAITLLAVVALAVGLVRSGDRGLGAMLPPRLWRRRGYRLMLVLGLGHTAGIYGMLFVVSLAVPAASGVSVWTLGLLLMPQAVGSGLVAPLSARWVGRVGSRTPMIAGCIGCGLGTGVFVLAGDGLLLPLVAIGALLCGVGGGTVMPALTTAVTVASPADLVGAGAGAFNAFRQLGTAGGVAVVGATAAIGDPLVALRVASVACVAVFVASTVAVAWWWPSRERLEGPAHLRPA